LDPEFMHSAVMEGFVWARVSGDIVFSFGVFAFALFMFLAFKRHAVVSDRQPHEPGQDAAAEHALKQVDTFTLNRRISAISPVPQQADRMGHAI
jgi:hypothetical protein